MVQDIEMFSTTCSACAAAKDANSNWKDYYMVYQSWIVLGQPKQQVDVTQADDGDI